MSARIFLFFVLLFSVNPAFSQADFAMGRLTARQTWWYFDYRLANPLPGMENFRVWIEPKEAWVKDIQKMSNGRYQGVADQMVCTATGTIEFDSTEIDDWLIVDNGILVGGFLLRQMDKQSFKRIRKKLRFETSHSMVSKDFVKESQINKLKSGDESKFADSLLGARFTGGMKGFYGNINKVIRYPAFARDNWIEGYTTISFVLNADGTISNYSTIRGIGAGTHEEVNKVFNSLSELWIAAPENQAASIRLTLPFAFRLR